MFTKAQTIAALLPASIEQVQSSSAFAPSNIALCKYWGKRDRTLNLANNASLSISLGQLGSYTEVALSASGQDEVRLNGEWLAPEQAFVQKVIAFVDLFRRGQSIPLRIDTTNTIPTAAGLASSASGFAALTLALNQSFGLQLTRQQLSIVARLGSGSACRSVYQGFVEWQRGERADGLDSYAVPLPEQWPQLRVGLVKVSTAAKAVDSRQGMQRTVETASLYQSWPAQAEQDLAAIKAALAARDFTRLGERAEHNALSMHATMIAAWPPLLYWQPGSVSAMQKVWALRQAGVEVYFTMDAGPNLKLLFEQDNLAKVTEQFGDLDVIAPFADI